MLNSQQNIIPYKTIRVFDPTRPQNETIVLQEGQNGYINLVMNDKTVVSLTKEEKIDEIIIEGTQGLTPEEVWDYEEVAFKTVIIQSHSLPKGEVRIIQDGRNGVKKVGKDLNQIVRPVTNRIIEYGMGKTRITVNDKASVYRDISEAEEMLQSLWQMRYRKKPPKTTWEIETDENGNLIVDWL